MLENVTLQVFKFTVEFCLLWISLDVLFCSASIMHLCTISVDRYLSLKNRKAAIGNKIYIMANRYSGKVDIIVRHLDN
ncbi:5-hydroxytryptamine receptor 2B [Armadillidium nasatum]|uniref:5-hydroxytryptamine receptor 2B n=1 Tax=Armadillidium nasatum TaxID=96803 RepID=A0A5N5TCS9_9CRUS|nr:5-hydroxytryptamine receptor 2B [Armadillidium nasatum]